MKKQFVNNLRLSKANIERLHVINNILEEYRTEWYVLTLRQLYYQLVSRDIIPNNVKEYAKISSLLVKGRMWGIVDWNIIEDRLRVPFLPYYCEDPADALRDTAEQYRIDRMNWQDKYIEVWVEKDALSWVLRRVTKKYHINLMVNRWYSSCTAMYDAHNRMSERGNNYILYVGDHDPSGLDMIRDVKERLATFGRDVNVIHVGITQEQIAEFNPPPNPAKFSDPRAARYIEKFWRTSREVDALPPEYLINHLSWIIDSLIDQEQYQHMLKVEKEWKLKLLNIANELGDD